MFVGKTTNVKLKSTNINNTRCQYRAQGIRTRNWHLTKPACSVYIYTMMFTRRKINRR